jgi:UDP-N-acetylmuramate--alanine ligase
MHFVGIGGIGMSGIAEIMYNLGYKIQGSDLSVNYNTERLSELGVRIFNQHDAQNIDNVDYVVISSAISHSNPEVQEAKKQGIPILRRAELLAELMRFKIAITVSGSHGKTTTTSMIASVFEHASCAPTVINGGIINGAMTNAYMGKGEYLIAEADESDATFINIPSTIAVITNIDSEHLDFYKNLDNLLQAFEKYILNLPFYGFAVVCLDNKYCAEIAQKITNRKILTYSTEDSNADILAFNIRCTHDKSIFDVKINLPSHKGEVVISNIVLPALGLHNISNSLAAIAIAAEMNFGIHSIQKGLLSFKGIKRRFTKIGEYKGVTFIDDYAHHPTEILATLKTAKLLAQHKNSRIIVVFQPHRYSRFETLYSEFLDAFRDADLLYVTQIYGAGEENPNNISHVNFVQNISYIPSFAIEDKEALTNAIATSIKHDDILLFLGAGSISSWAYQIFNELNNQKQ